VAVADSDWAAAAGWGLEAAEGLGWVVGGWEEAGWAARAAAVTEVGGSAWAAEEDAAWAVVAGLAWEAAADGDLGVEAGWGWAAGAG
jgi:hypothetical protein